MKKLIPFLFAIVLFASCEKDPDLDKVQNQFAVYTQYDTKADFATAKTYFIPDKVLLITSSDKPTYWTGAQAADIIKAFTDNMSSRGYTQVTDSTKADLGLQVSYVESTNYFVDNNYWWNDYPGYWKPSYWWPGYTGGWYYPYQTVYSYTTGSILSEIVDLRTASAAVAGSSSDKLTVIWNAYMTGLLTGSNQVNMNRAVEAINQSFTQSPYIKSTVK